MRTRRVRRKTGLRWFGSAVAPWAAGIGLLVSFTASAGTDAAAPFDQERLQEARLAPRLFPASGGATPGAGPEDFGPTLDLSGKSSVGATPEHSDDLRMTAATAGEIATGDGSTPAIPRAVALSSTTPAPADATPIEVAAASLMIPGFAPPMAVRPGASSAQAPAATGESRHHYTALIEPEAMDRERRCLAEAVYFEARSEPEAGQAAVAQVVLNRVKSGLYPTNVCGVVYQNRHRYMGCQFSFACEGKSLRIADGPSWQSATRIASAVIDGRTYLSEVGGATHYHADYVKPGWSRRLTKKDAIGRHIFYQLKRGQT